MSAHISTAVYAWCTDCSDGSEVGISRQEAESWAAEHDKYNHEGEGDA